MRLSDCITPYGITAKVSVNGSVSFFVWDDHWSCEDYEKIDISNIIFFLYKLLTILEISHYLYIIHNL